MGKRVWEKGKVQDGQKQILVFAWLLGIHQVHSSICKKISYLAAIPLPSRYPFLAALLSAFPGHFIQLSVS